MMSRRKRRKTKSGGGFNILKFVLVTGGVLLVAMVVVLMWARSALNGWLTGDGFRTWLTAKAGEVMKSEVELNSLKWEGMSNVYAEQFTARGYESAGFAKLDLDGVRAVFGGAKGEAFSVPEVTVNRMNLEFSNKREKQPRYDDTNTELAPSMKKSGMPDWISRKIPKKVEVDEVRIATTNVTVLDDSGAKKFALQSVRSQIMPDFEKGMWDINGQGGKLLVPDQPVIDLKNLELRWRGKELFVRNCALGIYEEGHIEGLGEIHFGDPGLFDLDLDISRIDVDDLVEGEWEERLSGIIRGPVKVTGKPGDLTYEGTLNVDEGLLEGVPVLKMVAKYTRSEKFNRLPLNETKTDFKRHGDLMELRNLVIQSDGLLRVEGSVDIRGEQLAGDLRVGVTPGTLRWIPGAERSVFTQSKDGFLWSDLKLAGTVSDPKEDLSGKLIAAAGEAMLKDLPAGAVDQVRKLLGGDKATEEEGDSPVPGSDLIKQGTQLLDLFGPLLK